MLTQPARVLRARDAVKTCSRAVDAHRTERARSAAGSRVRACPTWSSAKLSSVIMLIARTRRFITACGGFHLDTPAGGSLGWNSLWVIALLARGADRHEVV